MTSLPPLATTTDLDERGVGYDQLTVEALLDDVSATVRAYARQDISLVEDDTVSLAPLGPWLTLPQRPVVEDATHPITVAVGGIEQTGWVRQRDRLYLAGGWDATAGGQTRFALELPWLEPVTAEVTYSHGYEEVPSDVVALVCAMVARMQASPGPGITSESIGPYSYRNASAAGPVGLLTEEKALLSRYRRTARTGLLR